MTTPALLRLREAFPQTEIVLLTRDKLKELWDEHPAVSRVLAIKPGESPLTLGRKLKAEAFDAALVHPNSLRSAFEVFFGGVPQRIGYRHSLRKLLLTEGPASRPGQVHMRKKSDTQVQELIKGEATPSADPAPEAHQIHDYLFLGSLLGASAKPLPPALHVTRKEVLFARAGFIEGTPAEKAGVLLGINPGAEYGPAKRWPVQNFAAVMREVSRRCPEAAWIIFGGPGDTRVAEQLCAGNSGTVLNLAGKTGLRELLRLLAQCDVLLTNDTGPAHVAAALGTPLVLPFGSTSPELTAPGAPGEPSAHVFLRNRVPCAPCFRKECPIDFRCMTGIPVDRAVRAVLDLVEAIKRNR
jgi:heptosyltransferase-2